MLSRLRPLGLVVNAERWKVAKMERMMPAVLASVIAGWRRFSNSRCRVVITTYDAGFGLARRSSAHLA